MNIDSVDSSNLPYSIRAVSGQDTGEGISSLDRDRGDSLFISRKQQLLQLLAGIPEIRPEAVARGTQIAADPNYHSPEGVNAVAEKIAASGDLDFEFV